MCWGVDGGLYDPRCVQAVVRVMGRVNVTVVLFSQLLDMYYALK